MLTIPGVPMKRFTLAIIIIPLLFIFTYSCSDDESEPVRVYGEDTFVYDVEYSENTKIFADEIKESLIKVDTTTYLIELDKA